jgi:hypothetical protein
MSLIDPGIGAGTLDDPEPPVANLIGWASSPPSDGAIHTFETPVRHIAAIDRP